MGYFKMKFIFTLIAILPVSLFAHCPTLYKAEGACFMLEQNTLYIYDQKFEHNGPYKDLKVKMMTISDTKDIGLTYKKLAIGIYKLDSTAKVKEVRVTLDQLKILVRE
jgi:hypothetical protein